jgi:murein DD-endopeptidase MepM/ murein hydrolase activator NlpD
MDIIIISGKKNQTLNYRVSFGLIAAAATLILGILFLFLYNLAHFTTREIDRSRMVQLREENRVIGQELNRIEKEITELDIQIDSLELYDQRLRAYASLEPIENNLNPGVGGAAVQTDSAARMPNDLTLLDRTLDDLVNRARTQSSSFKALINKLDEKAYLRSRTPSIIPVQGWFMSGFGYRLDPFTGLIKMHEGIDIAAPIGTPIVAPADGSVTATGEKPGFGITIEIDHGYGLVTFYAHLQRCKGEPGMNVRRGDIIGYIGTTGKTTGPHLHYEVRLSSSPVNPINYILTHSTVVD